MSISLKNTNDKQGFIKIPRSLLSNPLWKDLPSAYKEVFFNILELACFQSRMFDDHGVMIELSPGQLCMSIREIKDRCGKHISKNDVERSINKLFLYGFLRQEVRHRKNLLTITIPGIYDNEIDSNETTSETILRQSRDKLETQIKKGRNEEEKKKEKSIKKEMVPKIAIREWVDLTQTEIDKLFDSHPAPIANKMLDILDAYNTSRQEHYDSDYGALKKSGWAHQKALETSSVSKFQTNGVDRRTQNIDGTPISSPVDGRF